MGFEIGAYASKLASTRPRTIETVTEEILDIKQRVAEDFMELGQRLCEAKELLPHGEWLPWLANNVQFSERQAQKFMALARGYEANPQLAADFGSEKAFALLDLPMEEREEIAKNGVEIDGKTKSTADLTTREVKQIVAERKVVSGVDLANGPSFTVDAVQAYLEARAKEDAEYRDLLQRQKLDLTKYLAFSPTRQDGIAALKRQLSSRSGFDGEVYYRGRGTGWELHQLRGDYIKRSWTELWDILAVMALQEVGKRGKASAPPEGQLAIAGWMPGITNPGLESGWCCTITHLPCNVTPRPKVMWWDGVLAQWKFGKTGDVVKIAPDVWMRLPEWHE